MTSFISITTPIAARSPFGATWDPEHNQHLVRIGNESSLFLDTPDARVLYASLGTSLAARGAVAMPTDLASRLELLAATLRWEGHTECADQVDAILALATDAEPGDADDAPALRAYSGRGPGGTPHCDECARVGHVRAHPDLGCGDVGCDAAHADPMPTEPIAAK